MRSSLIPFTKEIEQQAQCSNLFSHSKHYHSPIVHCMCPRGIVLVCLVSVIFLICITQEFTYMLNFRTYISTSPKWASDSHLKAFEWIDEDLEKSFERHHSYRTVSRNVEMDDWHYVADYIHAYSAYWDDRMSHNFITIVAGTVINVGNLNDLKCIVKNKSSSATYEELQTTYKILTEHHFKLSRAAYIMCVARTKYPPNFVALVPFTWNKTWTTKLSWMQVHRNPKKRPSLSHISICVRPLYNYTDTFRIAEFVAYYEALGVNHFTFYNYDSEPGVGKLIQQLQHNNYSIELLPWNLPFVIKDMWALGQLACINDCIYRHMATSSYVLIVDLDEFVTPRHAVKLNELMSMYDTVDKSFSNFVFKSTVFCSEYTPDTLPSTIPPFVTQSNIRRESKIYPFLIRSKYMVKPRDVIVAGIHHVWQLIPGAEERFVPANEVLVHHYRSQLCLKNSTFLGKGVIDPMSRKYLNHLMRSKAISAWRNVFASSSHYFNQSQ